METVRVFTDALADYDYPGMTKEIDPNAGIHSLSNGTTRPMRLVEIKESPHVGQIMRYGSGLRIGYVSGDPQLHQQIKYGYIVLKPVYLLGEMLKETDHLVSIDVFVRSIRLEEETNESDNPV